jgi:hypothetical protein
MASAELLKMTHGVDNRVKSVAGKVEDVCSDMHDVGNKVRVDVQNVDHRVRGVDDKLEQVNRSLSLTPAPRPKYLYFILGNQLRDSLLRWLSPPDPSTNHHIACKAHHDGTAEWFFQGSIFNQWKSAGSFLWVHGKRALISVITSCQFINISQFCSGIRQKCALVCLSPFSTFWLL